jgi:hypothetical protein
MLPRKTKADKKIMLNLNVYRNTCFAENNQAKLYFSPIVFHNFKANKIEVSYHVEKRTKRKFDTMNIISVVDKFFLDWLVASGALPDDSFKNVSYGSITGENDCLEDRVIATINVIGE